MASLFSDNFNAYTANNDLIGNNTEPSTAGGWTQQGTFFGGGYYSAASDITPAGSGKSWWLYNAYLNKLNTTNSTNTVYASFWTRSKLAFTASTASWLEFYLLDSSSKQITLAFCNDGSIRVYRGSSTGTLIATFVNAVSAQTWAQWEIKVVVDGAAGSIEIRKNSASSNTFAASGLNTRATSNSYINGAGFSSTYSDYAYIAYIDEFTLWDSSGVTPNTWTINNANVSAVGSATGGASASGLTTAGAICSTLDSGIYGVMRLYADGRLVATRVLRKSGEQWRLPSGFKAQFWQIEFEARSKIYSVEMATSAKELAGV